MRPVSRETSIVEVMVRGQRGWSAVGRVYPTETCVNSGGMTYVIGQPCVDVVGWACVEECPVDYVSEGGRALYIHPDECVDCGAGKPVCPVETLYYADDLPHSLSPYVADNSAFFSETLPGRGAPLGSPGGAAKLGVLGVDTPLVTDLPPQNGVAVE